MPKNPAWGDEVTGRVASKRRFVLPLLGAVALLPSAAWGQGAGLGAAAWVTAAFGFAAAQEAVRLVVEAGAPAPVTPRKTG